MASTVLRVGLNKNARGWWAWDLWRRIIILAIFIPVNEHYPSWLRQNLITGMCVVFLVVHVIVRPYQPVGDLDIDMGDFSCDKLAPFSIPDFLKKRCNLLEGLVLADMVVLSLMSTDSLDNGNKSSYRMGVMYVLLVLPLLAFYGLILLKVFRIARFRLIRHGYCLCCKYGGCSCPCKAGDRSADSLRRPHYTPLREEILGSEISYQGSYSSVNN